MAWVIGKSFAELSWAQMMPAIRKRSASPKSHLRDAPKPRTADLDELIEGEIIPRLMMAHTADVVTFPRAGNSKVSREEAERFAGLPLIADSSELMEEVDMMLARGVCVESILIDLLAPSARKLGKCWEDDVCDFVDVTVGLTRLHEVLREVASKSPGLLGQVNGPRSALFSPMPGDQHNFGTLMIEEIFSRAGWNSSLLVAPTRSELLDEVASQPFDVIGLTLSNDCSSRALTGLITAIRSVSANPQIQVLIGGRSVNANPLIADEVGADGTADNAQSALVLADQLVIESQPLLVSAI